MATGSVGSRLRALLVVTVLATVVGLIIPVIRPRALQAISTDFGQVLSLYVAANSLVQSAIVVLAVIAFLLVTNRSLSYIDLQFLSLRDIGYTIGGLIAFFIANVAISTAYSSIGSDRAGSETTAMLETLLTGGIAELVIVVLVALVLAPVIEELLYRNIVQKRLTESFSVTSAITIAGLLFAGVHVPAYSDFALGAAVWPFAGHFLAGVVFGAVYFKTQNILTAILTHSGGNMLALGLVVL